MKIEWSRKALKDREQIFDYLEEQNPRAAVQTDERIYQQICKLKDHPRIARTGRVSDTYELVVSETSYIVTYVLLGEVVRVLRILHSSRLWPEEMN